MNKQEINKDRRKNAQLYPIYKMFSWDLLFFYSIEFLFYTITKGLTATEVLIVSGLYIIFKVIMYIPAVAISDIFGKRKTIILGNFLIVLQLCILIFLPGMLSVIIANLFYAIGYSLKSITESNLLYDSVATKGGDGLYEKLDAKGGSLYYLLDGIASLMSGYLFVVNNYLSIYICLGFVIISTILSCFFKEIYETKKVKKTTLKSIVKEYNNDLIHYENIF